MAHSAFLSLRRFSACIALLLCAGIALILMPASRAELVFSARVMGPVANLYSVSDKSDVDKKSEPEKLTDNGRWRDLDATSVSNGIIAFSSNREENPTIDPRKNREDFNIFLVDTSGKKLQQITDHPGYDTLPKFSPNGKWLAYRRHIDGKSELRLFNRKNKQEKVLVTASDIFDFSWSADNKKITFASLDNQESKLAIVSLESPDIEVLLKTSREPQSEENGGYEFHQTQITSSIWSPDGNKIAFILHPLEQGGVRQLRVFSLNSNQHGAISPDGAQVQQTVTWSKNSKTLLYSALIGYKFWYNEVTHKKVYEGGMHIFISDLEGKTSQITEGDHLFSNPVYSPDNKRIAFLYSDSLETRVLTLKTMSTDGSGISTLYHPVARQSSLLWY